MIVWVVRQKWAIGFSLLLVSCLQNYNSSTLDALLYRNPSGSLSPQLALANDVFVRNCSFCHEYHTMTESELRTAGLVEPRNPENSKIYFRLFNSVGGNGPKNMPQSGPMPPSDLDAIRDWIMSM